ncbi:MAG: hypothetical protein QGF90_13920 [Gammaproteobacteria bacterium]|nr:hypothetical protein [Gammaproteobacteria bacterium]
MVLKAGGLVADGIQLIHAQGGMKAATSPGNSDSPAPLHFPMAQVSAPLTRSWLRAARQFPGKMVEIPEDARNHLLQWPGAVLKLLAEVQEN